MPNSRPKTPCIGLCSTVFGDSVCRGCLRFVHEGEVFNEIGVLAKKPNPATAVALEESGIWLIPREALEKIVLAHPRTAMQIIENMADKIISLVSLAADLSLKTVEARFVNLLLEQADTDLY